MRRCMADETRYAVLFGQSPNSNKIDKMLVEDDGFSGPGGYFSRRILRMLRDEHLQQGDALLSFHDMTRD